MDEGEVLILRDVFRSSVHMLAQGYYTQAQLEAWAPGEYDQSEWVARLKGLQVYVAELDGQVAGYAGLGADGHVAHFFVAPKFARRDLGTALMGHLEGVARRMKLAELTADVSLAAERFFGKHGFQVQARQSVVRRGVVLANARMAKVLSNGAAYPARRR